MFSYISDMLCIQSTVSGISICNICNIGEVYNILQRNIFYSEQNFAPIIPPSTDKTPDRYLIHL
jgi:hypothetical protein